MDPLLPMHPQETFSAAWDTIDASAMRRQQVQRLHVHAHDMLSRYDTPIGVPVNNSPPARSGVSPPSQEPYDVARLVRFRRGDLGRLPATGGYFCVKAELQHQLDHWLPAYVVSPQLLADLICAAKQWGAVQHLHHHPAPSPQPSSALQQQHHRLPPRLHATSGLRAAGMISPPGSPPGGSSPSSSFEQLPDAAVEALLILQRQQQLPQ